MPAHSLAALALFALQFVAVLVTAYLFRRSGTGILGTPPIDPPVYIIGKITAFISWFLFFSKALFPSSGLLNTPIALSWVAIALMAIANLIILMAFLSKCRPLRIGLQSAGSGFCSHGIYRFSRNPLYLSIDLICIASVLYFPDLINLTSATVAIIIHHFIIRGEEEYYERRYPESWAAYIKQTRRYL